MCLSSFHQFYLFNDDNNNNTANIRNAFSEKYGLQTTLRVAGIAGVLGRRGQQISHTPHMRLYILEKNELPFMDFGTNVIVGVHRKFGWAFSKDGSHA